MGQVADELNARAVIQKLQLGLEQRLLFKDKPEDKRAIDDRLRPLMRKLDLALRQRPRERSGEAPPRKVAVAMALAFHAAPHSLALLDSPQRQGTVNLKEAPRAPADPPAMLTTEQLSQALGLSKWEIDDLREEVDRRASTTLKQSRAASWLWSWAEQPGGSPSTLYLALFPGSDPNAHVGSLQRGGQIYAFRETDHPPPLAALYLPWLDHPQRGICTAFHAESVEEALRKRLSRGVGADEREARQLLHAMVALLPRDGAEAYLQFDQWRQHGRANLTDLGIPYTAPRWLSEPLAPDSCNWRSWLVQDADGMLAIKGQAHKVFDALALPRVTTMMRAIYAALLADVDSRAHKNDKAGYGPIDLDLYDMHQHLHAVLGPLLTWTASPKTHEHIAAVFKQDPGTVAASFKALRRAWRDHAATAWWGQPASGAPGIRTILIRHTVVLHSALRRMVARRPHAEAKHADLTLLFAANYLREARLERLWLRQLSDVAPEGEGLPPPEDIVGSWFWATWMRLIEGIQDNTGPLRMEGLSSPRTDPPY